MRVSWDDYFIKICKTVAERATCDRGKTACIIVKDNRILATGYVGSPPKMEHCDDVGHMLRKVIDENGNISMHCVRTLHAEQNAIIQAAKFGISLDGATCYILMTPCYTCAKMLVSVGIKRIVSEKRYHADKDSLELFRKAGVEVVILKDELVEYPNQK